MDRVAPGRSAKEGDCKGVEWGEVDSHAAAIGKERDARGARVTSCRS